MAKVYFIDTGNMHFMPLGEMHVPCINEIYLGLEPCLINPGENPEMVIGLINFFSVTLQAVYCLPSAVTLLNC